MKLTLKYFGMIEESIGKSEDEMSFENTLSVSELHSKLISKYPSIKSKSFQIAVNQELKDNDFIINDNAEIALLPPFAGG